MSSLMNPVRAAFVFAAITVGASAAFASTTAITDDFSTYKIGDAFSTGQTLGAEGMGWLGGWRTASSHVTTTARIADAQPPHEGSYMAVKLVSEAGQPLRTGGAVSRAYSPPEKPFTLSFRYRAAVIPPGMRYVLFDNDARAAGTGHTSSWQIEIIDGQWRLIDGGGNGAAEVYVDTGVVVSPGEVYAITLQIDPSKRLWAVEIAGPSGTVSRQGLNFRTNAFTTERWIHFGAGEVQAPGLGLTAEWAVDSISIQPRTN